jgi:hypothetical protein
MQHIESETMNEPCAEMSERTFRTVVRTDKQKGEKSHELRGFSNHLPSAPRSSKAHPALSVDDIYPSECNGAAIASSSKLSRLLGAGLEMLKRLTGLPGCSRMQIPASLPRKK